MINLRLSLRKKQKCGKRVTRMQNKTITSMWNTFSLAVCLFRSAEITEAISLALHSVYDLFLVHPTAKIWRDFKTFLPLLIFRELWLRFTQLYIFDKLKNVQSIVNRRNWTRVNYFQTTWPWRCRRRHRSWDRELLLYLLSHKGNFGLVKTKIF